MAFAIDKNEVIAGFSRAAKTYDAWALPQQQIAARLIELLPPGQVDGAILDLGCGTGCLTRLLRRRYPLARIIAVDIAPGMIDQCARAFEDDGKVELHVADAEHFVAASPCQLVLSSSSFQWFADRKAALGNAVMSLAEGGRFAMAVPVSGTLRELSESFEAAASCSMPTLEFPGEKELFGLLKLAGLAPAAAAVEETRFEYASPLDLLRSIKGIGAAMSRHRGAKPLPPAKLGALVDYYRRCFSTDLERVTATYRVLYLVSEPFKR